MESSGDKSNYQPPLPEDNHGATKLWGVQYREVTPQEIEMFGNELRHKHVKMTCEFIEVSDTWVRILLGNNHRFVGIMVYDSDNNCFQYVFANKNMHGRALLQKKNGDILRLIGKIKRVKGEYMFMIGEIHE